MDGQTLVLGMLSGILGAIVLLLAVGFWLHERKNNRRR